MRGSFAMQATRMSMLKAIYASSDKNTCLCQEKKKKNKHNAELQRADPGTKDMG